MRGLHAADEAFRANSDDATFMQFMRARQRYFIIAEEAERCVALSLAIRGVDKAERGRA